MNTKTLGLLREFLTAASAALIAYGFGSDAIWQEAVGGLMALITLIWGVYANDGMEAWFSLARKVLSSIGGVLTLTGTLEPDKAELLLGLAVSFLSMAWSLFGKGNSLPPVVPLLALLAACSFLLPSCGVNGEYPITGSLMLRDPDSGAKGGLVFEKGAAPRASFKMPIVDPDTGKLIGMADFSTALAKKATVIPEK